ncbi:MAG: DMT family transporter [Holosporales bacterium]|jgi:S-adenosylmethionine uptake transporter|nr:DMT family transporter [Holosporales bacterium]
MLYWFSQKGLRQGIFWASMIYLTSAMNDVLSKCLGSRLHFVEISFFRFFFSSIIALIAISFSKRNLFKSTIHKWHLWRGALGAIALGLCCYSVNIMPLAENTTILFSESLFMLPLAAVFLHEKIRAKSLYATFIGFLGLLIMFRPSASNINITAIIPTIAAILFATMNVMIKKMVDSQENNLTMLFYFGLYTTIITSILVPFFWQTPTISELILIALLGLGANLIQLFIFLAYRASSAADITPIRYIELPFAMIFGFAFFSQVPEITAIVGAVFIIVGTLISSRGASMV